MLLMFSQLISNFQHWWYRRQFHPTQRHSRRALNLWRREHHQRCQLHSLHRLGARPTARSSRGDESLQWAVARAASRSGHGDLLARQLSLSRGERVQADDDPEDGRTFYAGNSTHVAVQWQWERFHEADGAARWVVECATSCSEFHLANGDELSAGLYFQIRDDYCNLSLKEYSENKSFCEDLTEGKFSFPIIHAINTQKDDKQVLRKLNARLPMICDKIKFNNFFSFFLCSKIFRHSPSAHTRRRGEKVLCHTAGKARQL